MNCDHSSRLVRKKMLDQSCTEDQIGHDTQAAQGFGIEQIGLVQVDLRVILERRSLQSDLVVVEDVITLYLEIALEQIDEFAICTTELRYDEGAPRQMPLQHGG